MNIAKFMIDAYKGNVVNYNQADANEVIRKAFVDIVGTEKLDYKTFRRHKVEIFEIMEEVLDQLVVEGWEANPFFEQFVEYKNVNFGDRPSFYIEDKSVLSIAEYSGNHWNIRRQRLTGGSEFTVSTKAYGVKIYEEFKLMLAGRTNFVTLIQKVEKAFEDHIRELIYVSFMGASANLPSTFKVNGAFSEEKLTELVAHVQATNGSKEVIITGTRTALSKITGAINSQWISENMKDQKHQNGLLLDWNGIKLMPIEQVHKKGTFEFAVDDKKLFVLPSDCKPVKFVTEGQAIVKEVNEDANMDRSVEYMVEKNFGVATILNCAYGAYELA